MAWGGQAGAWEAKSKRACRGTLEQCFLGKQGDMGPWGIPGEDNCLAAHTRAGWGVGVRRLGHIPALCLLLSSELARLGAERFSMLCLSPWKPHPQHPSWSRMTTLRGGHSTPGAGQPLGRAWGSSSREEEALAPRALKQHRTRLFTPEPGGIAG